MDRLNERSQLILLARAWPPYSLPGWQRRKMRFWLRPGNVSLRICIALKKGLPVQT